MKSKRVFKFLIFAILLVVYFFGILMVFNVVETNFVHGGMEYPNLVYISDAIDSVEDYQNVIIHETAHQWWYGIVGNSAYHYGWLDEGLTEYSTLLFYEQNPSYNVNIKESIKASTNSYVLFEEIYTEYLENLDTSLDRNISEYDTEPEYVYMAYVKGMLLFDNLRDVVGDKKFFKALKDYYSNNIFELVTPNTLIDDFSVSCKTNLKSFFDSWINGEVVIKAID
jgi:aminopeptidase N